MVISAIIPIKTTSVIIVGISSEMDRNKIMRNHPVARTINKPGSAAIYISIIMIVITITVVVAVITIIIAITVPRYASVSIVIIVPGNGVIIIT